MRNLFVTAFFVAFLAGCGPSAEQKAATAAAKVASANIAAAQQAAAASFFDPVTAQFRGSRYYERGTGPLHIVCGEANAKNRFGGYVGFRPFVAILKDGDWVVAQPENGTSIASAQKCWNVLIAAKGRPVTSAEREELTANDCFGEFAADSRFWDIYQSACHFEDATVTSLARSPSS